MRSSAIAALLGVVAAQSATPQCLSNQQCNDLLLSSSSNPPAATQSLPTSSGQMYPSTASSYEVSSSSLSAIASSSSATVSAAKTAITVAADGSAQFTAINAGISAAQASGIPTVTILSGVYTEAVTVLGSATVTIVGATATAAADWSQNQVTIKNLPSNTLPNFIPFAITTSANKGVTLRNLNIVSSLTGNAPAISLQGANNALYGCSVVSSGAIAVSAAKGLAFIANSYVEGTTQIFYNSPTLYLYKSTVVPTAQNALLVYNKGATPYNSTVVFDSCSVQQKSGLSNTNVYLAVTSVQLPTAGAPSVAANSVAIFRDTALGSFIAPAGIHANTASFLGSTYYGEYQTTGAGSYAMRAASRASYANLLSAETVARFTVEKVFASAPSPFGSSSLAWVDQSVLSSLLAANAVQAPSVSSIASIASSLSSSAPPSSLSSIASVVASVASVSSSLSGIPLDSSNSMSASLTVPTSSFSVSVDLSASAITVSTSTLSSSSPSASSSVPSCTPLAASATLVVSKTPGPCEYNNVTSAIAALPNDKNPYTIKIGAGTYVEQLSITRNGKVTLIGATNSTRDFTQNQVRIEISNGRLTNLNQNEQTPVLYAKKTNDNSGLAVYNIDFVNTYPQTKNTAALAADFYGANIAAYGCSFIGYQDTLLANKGTQVFSNCYIEGSIDFIWGFSTAYFHQCKIVSNTPGGYIAAQSRATAATPGGYIFDSCMVTYSSSYGASYGLSYLGRPYSAFSVVVYMNSYIDKHINSAGWTVWQTNDPRTSDVTFGEYNNFGPGSWQATTQRASFATNLSADQAANYELAKVIGDTSWLDMTSYNQVPSYSLTGPSITIPSGTSSSATSSSTATASGPAPTSKVNAHPDSGTIPSVGSIVVSTDGVYNASFNSLTAALASLPNDSTNQTIFMYPGTYKEQVPSINRPGAVRIIGYTTGSPGQSYKGNQVTISYARGLSVSPLPAGHSNAETAVIATGSSRISFYNINMINTDNLDGSEASYVALAASVYGNDIAFYGCSFDGWQDTLLTGATAGYQYYESCYIGGAIDFIWGYSKAYFKGCTLGAKRASSCITAQSRQTSSSIGGYIFDQCLFTAAPDATVDLTNKVYLGRPYSQYALVVVKNSYIDKTINPVGWKIWSATDPRTAAITFAEYNNVGPSNWENNVASRQTFGYATLLTSDSYPLSSVMDSTEWIDMTYWNSIVTPQPAAPVVVSPTNTTVNGSSVFNGTAPPTGALIVSKTPITGVTTYLTIQAALDAAPTTSKINATIFIYPGVYEEQLILNKSGHTIFQGFSSATDDYKQNQVTIQFSRGIDTQGTSGSNTDGATVYATGNYFHAYNINFRNNFGTQQNMASLGFAVKSSKYAGLYGCQVYGNQDTLSVSGNLFTFKTYIEGNIDFIYGTGSAYFLASTIATNEDGVSITASKRATNVTNAGFVFDQCTVQPAAGLGPFTKVGLGRPWNNFSRVAYVNSYLSSMITPAGWNPWSKSSPQTDGVQYGEYHNFGPGASICNRASFSQQLSDSEVVQYQLGNFFATTSFIEFSKIDTQPFSVGIGSAQTCSTASSSVGATSTQVSSSLSASRTSSVVPSSISLSSLPVVTAYTTTTLTAKLTASTMITAPDVTSTSVLKQTLTVTESGADVVKLSTQKATATVSYTSPDVYSTSTYVTTENVGLTITPNPIIKTSTIKSTVTVGSVTTKAAATSTVKSTTTLTHFSTSTPKAATATVSQGQTVLSTSTITPKGGLTTLKITTSLNPSKTKTITIEPKDSVTVNTVSYKTTTKKTTTTLSCIPTTEAKRMVRRGAIIPRAVASTITLTSTSTLTTYVKTLTATKSGSTSLTTLTSIAATKTTSIKGSTLTSTITAVVATSTAEFPGLTHRITITSTSKVGKTTTLKASTSTVFATNYETITSLSTVTADAITITSVKTQTKDQIVVLAQPTVVVTRSSDITSIVRTTLPVQTETRTQMITQGGGTQSITVTAASKTKTVVQKSTITVVALATRTAKGAQSCTV
ncbi:hypothetical protein NX059_010964 [Plenodomus lindquistii]|nr:hypothetical protein NX059_010964 [Plenodomus lindquistii]